MSWRQRMLGWLSPPLRLPPVTPREHDDTHEANTRLAEAWQARLESQVAELDAQVGELALELRLHELEHQSEAH